MDKKRLAKVSLEKCGKYCDHTSSENIEHENNNKTMILLSENDKSKVSDILYCNICDYHTPYKCNWEKHIVTEKHLYKNDKQKVSKVSEKYFCDLCDYTTSYKCNWNRHITTVKHLYKHDLMKPAQHNDANSLQDTTSDKNSESDIVKITAMFLDSMKQNQEFQKQIFDMMKDNVGINNNSNNTTTNNTKFNLNFFLNETCKDAMNLSEFVDSLKITLTDLENVGKLGYTEGISRIFTNGLKELDISKRPIHCSDFKRETVYVKNENKWEKDDEHLKKAIKQITNKNIRLIPLWKKENPGHQEYHNKKNDDYLKIMYESMGPTDDLEESKTYSKIITNLAKQTIISR